MTFRKILAPVDYSANSRVSLGLAVDLARKFSAGLEIVHVWDRPTYLTEAMMTVHGTGERRLTDLIAENAEHDMQTFLTEVPLPSDLPYGHHLLSGDPASELLREIEKGAYDLVVLGTHGRSGLSRLLLGSIAEKIVRHAAVPVLTVPRRV
jgi:nucleotide-binding universal stress UspA family protein